MRRPLRDLLGPQWFAKFSIYQCLLQPRVLTWICSVSSHANHKFWVSSLSFLTHRSVLNTLHIDSSLAYLVHVSDRANKLELSPKRPLIHQQVNFCELVGLLAGMPICTVSLTHSRCASKYSYFLSIFYFTRQKNDTTILNCIFYY